MQKRYGNVGPGFGENQSRSSTESLCGASHEHNLASKRLRGGFCHLSELEIVTLASAILAG